MREFYEGKLRGMEELLHQKEAESEEVAEKLKQLGIGHNDHKELSENLRKRQEQIADLKRKQKELSRLTSVASHNERQLCKLRQEVLDMKERKVSLQKQLTDERKNHLIEVKKLKMESMQKDREMIKIKKVSDRKAFEAQKAQQMAKTRMEQMAQLKSKYKETEKHLRMQTVKHGVMEKAGLDPVMVGRREKSKVAKAPVSATSNQNKKDAASSNVNFDAIRDFFDQKVADVGRREALAEKIAQEWEEHLDLTIRREELTKNDLEGAGYSQELNSIHSQIKYKEERIRQLAARLGKRQSEKSSDDSTSEREAFLFDKHFNAVIGSKSNCR
jgi:hypothetical protein